MTDPAIREPDEIRKRRPVEVSEHFQAILGCLLSEVWTQYGFTIRRKNVFNGIWFGIPNDILSVSAVEPNLTDV